MRQVRRSGLTLGCARNLPLLTHFFFNIIDVAFVCCGNTISGTQAGGSGTEGQDEYMGASLCFLPLARKGRTLRCFSCAFFGTRTLQAKNGFELSPHRITAERRASYSVRLFHRATFLPSRLTRIPVLACACRSRTCVIMHQCTMCQIENRSRHSRDG